MTTILTIITAILAAAISALIVRVAQLRKTNAAQVEALAECDMQREQLTSEIASANAQAGDQALRYATHQSRLEAEIAILRERLESQAAQHAAINEAQKSDRAKLEEQFAHQFRNLANEILEDKSTRFTQTNKANIDQILKPLSENIEKFRQRIEAESTARQVLEKEIGRLYEMSNRISSEANNLASALRGNSKMQGDWGEMILSTLLESSGLQKGVHFTVQESFRDDNGGMNRPDVILNLPDNKRMIIDSKVSLKNYADYVAAQDKTAQEAAMNAHLISIRSHINELGGKDYHKMSDSLDFVIMFIPTEPALLVALQNDPKLWSDAYTKKVILSSPTNLFAILKIVDDLWRRDSQDRYALEIARQGGALYDKFVGFADNFLAIGDALGRTDKAYQSALGQLNQGKGNLVSRAERLRELGIKASKKMPQALEPMDGLAMENHTEQEPT